MGGFGGEHVTVDMVSTNRAAMSSAGFWVRRRFPGHFTPPVVTPSSKKNSGNNLKLSPPPLGSWRSVHSSVLLQPLSPAGPLCTVFWQGFSIHEILRFGTAIKRDPGWERRPPGALATVAVKSIRPTGFSRTKKDLKNFTC